MAMLAAFQTLLYRYTGEEDIIVSTGIANRMRAEVEPLIGFFVNTLVLRTDFGGSPSFRELLKRVREVTLGAYAHQDVPFELIVEAMQPERNPSYTPIFQVMFMLQNAPLKTVQVPELNLNLMGGESTTAKFDLTLFIEEGREHLAATMEYNTDLFDTTTIRRLLGYYQALLESIIADPAEEVDSLSLITEEESKRLIEAWS
jgi:non-ribosomal peptide synthetase component F